jgi:CheY-like chemotaxis protein
VETEVERLKARVRELETLCAEVYGAAVELGLPQDLLIRLWTAVSHGDTPHAFVLDAPTWPPAQAPATAASAAADPVNEWLSASSAPAGRAGPAVRKAEAPLQPLRGRRTVLVVDDESIMLKLLVRILSKENYELLTAGSGAEALEVIEGHARPVDLLVTDFSMPEMSGRELAMRLRRRYPDVKVLYQTGFSDLLFENRAELEDAAAFLEKPFTARGLREATRLLLFGALNP